MTIITMWMALGGVVLWGAESGMASGPVVLILAWLLVSPARDPGVQRCGACALLTILLCFYAVVCLRLSSSDAKEPFLVIGAVGALCASLAAGNALLERLSPKRR